MRRRFSRDGSMPASREENWDAPVAGSRDEVCGMAEFADVDFRRRVYMTPFFS